MIGYYNNIIFISPSIMTHGMKYCVIMHACILLKILMSLCYYFFPVNLPPPPTDLRLIEAASGELTFNWTAPLQNCPSLVYTSNYSGGCICPSNSGSNNTLTCIGTQCIIRVYSIICTGMEETVSRTSSNVLSVNFTGI